ncbi:MAG: hypothetical protein AAF226_16585, partial [Verrucomicrobiota bacterium]
DIFNYSYGVRGYYGVVFERPDLLAVIDDETAPIVARVYLLQGLMHLERWADNQVQQKRIAKLEELLPSLPEDENLEKLRRSSVLALADAHLSHGDKASGQAYFETYNWDEFGGQKARARTIAKELE